MTDRTLRRLLRESGWALHPLVEGVRQESFDELGRTLLNLVAEYANSNAGGRQACRDAVITARDHARFALRSAARRAEKEEMILWMRTWLENPPVFPVWLELRRRLRDNGEHEPKSGP